MVVIDGIYLYFMTNLDKNEFKKRDSLELI